MATVLGLIVVVRAACAWGAPDCSWALSIERYIPWPAAIFMMLTSLVLLLLGLGGAPAGAADAIVRAASHPSAPLLIGICVIVWLPDRVHFLGDSMLRQSEFDPETYRRVFPQASRLDVWIFTTVRTWASLSPPALGRTLGVLGFLGVWAGGVRLARSLSADRSARVVVMWVLIFSGYLIFCTGYAKVTPILCGIVALAVAFAVEALESSNALVPLLLCASVAAVLHRSGLILAPLAAVLMIRSGTHHLRKPGLFVSSIIFVASLTLAVPPAWQVFHGFDAAHNFDATTGLAALNADHFRSFAEVTVVLAPSVLLVPLLVLLPLAGGSRRYGILVVPVAAAAAALAVLVFIAPPQGLIRDWDVLALGGLLLSFVLATALGILVALVRPGAWLTLALVATVVFPTFQWVFNAHDRDRGLARIEAVVRTGRLPTRAEAGLLDYLASEYLREGRWADAVRTLQEELRKAPHRRVYLALALAEAARGEYAGAARVYRALLEKVGPDPLGYLGLAGAAAALGDTIEARRSIERLRALPVAEIAQCLQYVRAYPHVWPLEQRELLRYALEPALARKRGGVPGPGSTPP